MGLGRAVEYAFSKEEKADLHPTSAPEESSADQAPVALTRREREVAALVAHGHSNRQIASDLFLSERTIENQIANIKRKLGRSSRTEIAAWATQQRLIAPEPD